MEVVHGEGEGEAETVVGRGKKLPPVTQPA